MLISIHIPRCGGASFRRALEEIYGADRVQVRPGTSPRRGWVPWRTACVHGPFPSDAFDAAFPDAARVTWLRHPVERLVSQYHHFRRQPDWAHPACQALRDRRLSLEEFAALPAARNETVRALAGKPLSAFRFVGILERAPESLRLFAEIFGRSAPADLGRENANPDREEEGYYLPDGLHAHIAGLNAGDLALYDSALAQLERCLRPERRPVARTGNAFRLFAGRQA